MNYLPKRQIAACPALQTMNSNNNPFSFFSRQGEPAVERLCPLSGHAGLRRRLPRRRDVRRGRHRRRRRRQLKKTGTSLLLWFNT